MLPFWLELAANHTVGIMLGSVNQSNKALRHVVLHGNRKQHYTDTWIMSKQRNVIITVTGYKKQ